MTDRVYSAGSAPDGDLNRRYAPLPPVQTYKTITLERVTNAKPTRRWIDYHLGSIFTYTYKSLAHDQALIRAMTQLKAQGEDPAHWKEVK